MYSRHHPLLPLHTESGMIIKYREVKKTNVLSVLAMLVMAILLAEAMLA